MWCRGSSRFVSVGLHFCVTILVFKDADLVSQHMCLVVGGGSLVCVVLRLSSPLVFLLMLCSMFLLR